MSNTAHNHQVVFGRKEADCPRCFELRMGAPARQWAGNTKRRFEAQAVSAIRAHDCSANKCGPVCTFGDW